MSAARARRRLMAHERYRRRALLLGAASSMTTYGYSQSHAVAYGMAQCVGRAAPHGIRRDPWTLSVRGRWSASPP